MAINKEIVQDKKCVIWDYSGTLRKTCCSDYEMQGDHCYRCALGYTTDVDNKCKPCSENTFGDRCRSKCTCGSYQECHHINGCVDLKSVERVVSTYEDDMSTVTQVMSSTIKSENSTPSVHPISKSMVLSLTISISILIVLGLLGYMLYRYLVCRKKKREIQRQLPTIRGLPPLPLLPNVAENQYDLINEQNMVDMEFQVVQRNEYLDVITDPNSSNGDQSPSINSVHESDIKTDRTGYLISKGTNLDENKISKIDTTIGVKQNCRLKTDSFGYLSPNTNLNVDVHVENKALDTINLETDPTRTKQSSYKSLMSPHLCPKDRYSILSKFSLQNTKKTSESPMNIRFTRSCDFRKQNICELEQEGKPKSSSM